MTTRSREPPEKAYTLALACWRERLNEDNGEDDDHDDEEETTVAQSMRTPNRKIQDGTTEQGLSRILMHFWARAGETSRSEHVLNCIFIEHVLNCMFIDFQIA